VAAQLEPASPVTHTHHVVIDEGAALLDEARHGEGHVLHRPVRHRATERREPERILVSFIHSDLSWMLVEIS